VSADAGQSCPFARPTGDVADQIRADRPSRGTENESTSVHMVLPSQSDTSLQRLSFATLVKERFLSRFLLHTGRPCVSARQGEGHCDADQGPYNCGIPPVLDETIATNCLG
jgi:hypothetical protein